MTSTERRGFAFFVFLGITIGAMLVFLQVTDAICPCDKSCVWTTSAFTPPVVYKSVSVQLSSGEYLPCIELQPQDCVPRPMSFVLPSYLFPAQPENDLPAYCGFFRFTECGTLTNQFGDPVGTAGCHWGIYADGTSLILDICNYLGGFYHTFFGWSGGIGTNHVAVFTNQLDYCNGFSNRIEFGTATFYQ